MFVLPNIESVSILWDIFVSCQLSRFH